MANRYWVNDDGDNVWHNANNWAATSGGAGGAGIPTSSDDVYFDGNGDSDCTASAAAECNNLNIASSYTSIIGWWSGPNTIHGNYTQAGQAEPNRNRFWLRLTGNQTEFKGNFDNTAGGEFLTAGFDKTICVFSGTSKTYRPGHDIQFYDLSITGSLNMDDPTSLTENLALVYGDLSVTGDLTLDASGSGSKLSVHGTFSTLDSGSTIDGTGGLYYNMDNATDTFPSTGTVDCDVSIDFGASTNFPAREFGDRLDLRPTANCTTTIDAGTLEVGTRCRFLGSGAATNWTLDFATNDATFIVGRNHIITDSMCYGGTFTWKLGTITEFHRNVDWGYSPGTFLDVQAGSGTVYFFAGTGATQTYELCRPPKIGSNEDRQDFNNMTIIKPSGTATTHFKFFRRGFNCNGLFRANQGLQGCRISFPSMFQLPAGNYVLNDVQIAGQAGNHLLINCYDTFQPKVWFKVTGTGQGFGITASDMKSDQSGSNGMDCWNSTDGGGNNNWRFL